MALPTRRWMFTASALALTPTSCAAAFPTGHQVPAHFREYEATELTDGMTCIAGASADEDATNQRPTVILRNKDGKVMWEKQFDIPARFYQGRATRCMGRESELYVLLQDETHSQQTLTQTTLRLIRLDKDGRVMNEVDVPVEGNGSRYTMRLKVVEVIDDAVVVSGMLMAKDADVDLSFSTTTYLKSLSASVHAE